MSHTFIPPERYVLHSVHALDEIMRIGSGARLVWTKVGRKYAHVLSADGRKRQRIKKGTWETMRPTVFNQVESSSTQPQEENMTTKQTETQDDAGPFAKAAKDPCQTVKAAKAGLRLPRLRLRLLKRPPRLLRPRLCAPRSQDGLLRPPRPRRLHLLPRLRLRLPYLATAPRHRKRLLKRRSPRSPKSSMSPRSPRLLKRSA